MQIGKHAAVAVILGGTVALLSVANWLRQPTAAAALSSATAVQTSDGRAAAPPELKQQARVERGRYLVTAMGCNDCHTPWKMGPNGPEPDMTRMLSGHPQGMKLKAPAPASKDTPWVWSGAMTNTAFAGPWGVSYAANLTPHPVHSTVATWDEARFMKAIRTGRHFGESRPIMPPMPWPAFRNLSDEDLGSIWSYLRTIPPIANNPPDYEPPAQH
jgi:hypothetical protein